ncbi:MAG: OmpA family protein [Alphaproteobacteria bacterium]|nr:OmpA family protein [Alphaproteobacteria bacterium]
MSPLSLFAAAVLLAGCSYFDAPDPTAQQIDLMNGGNAQAREDVSNLNIQGYDDVAGAVSTSQVQLYGFDGQAAPVSPARISSGQGSSMKPSVEVFPLGGGAPYAMREPISSMPAAAPVTPVEMDGGHVGMEPIMEHGAPAPVINSVSTNGAARIYFPYDSSTLSGQDEQVLDEIAQRVSGRNVRVVGYASSEASINDPITRKMVNLRKSLDRAYAVSKGLIGKGVPAESIETVGYGENVTGAGSAEARRVEIQPQ